MKRRLHVVLVGALLIATTAFPVSGRNAEIAFFVSQRSGTLFKSISLPEKIKQAFDVEVELLDNSRLLNLHELMEFKIIVSDKDLSNAKEFTALSRFVDGGGYLVALGEFGRWLDSNTNGVVDKKADKAHPAEAKELTGCAIISRDLAVQKIRNLSVNPVLRNFHLNKWIEYPVYAPTASSLKIEGDAIPLAEASYRPFGYKSTDFKHKYFSSRFYARYNCYIAAKKAGKGMTVRVAENLFLVPFDDPLFAALWGNLLEASTFNVLSGQFENLRCPLILYDHENFIPNPDFGDVCVSSAKENVAKNFVSGEILMPACWQFNSWKGRYSGEVRICANDYGQHVLTVRSDDPDSRCGGSIWSVYCDQTILPQGVAYTISIQAQGAGITRGGFGISVQDSDNNRHEFKSSFPSGSFDWQRFEHTFTIPRSFQLMRGFVAKVSFTGPGKLSAVHFLLKRAE